MLKKIYVTTTVQFSPDGKITPLSVLWSDGRTLEIDKIIDIRHTHCVSGGIAERYTVRIKNKETYIFYDHPRWFVETQNP